MTSQTSDLIGLLEDRVKRLLVTHGVWWPGPVDGVEYELRTEGYWFFWSTWSDGAALFVRTLPSSIDPRIVYCSVTPNDILRDEVETSVLPLIDRLLLLDDLAGVIDHRACGPQER